MKKITYLWMLLLSVLLILVLPSRWSVCESSEIYILPLRAPADETKLNSITYANANLPLLVHIPADRFTITQSSGQITGLWDLYYIDQDEKFVSFTSGSKVEKKVLTITNNCSFDCYKSLPNQSSRSNIPKWGLGFPSTTADSPKPFTRFLTETDWHARLVEIQRENPAEKDSFLVLRTESWGKDNETVAVLRGETFYYQTIPWSNEIPSSLINAKPSIPQLYEIAGSDSTILDKTKSPLYQAKGSFRLFYQRMNESAVSDAADSYSSAEKMLSGLKQLLGSQSAPAKLYLNPEADAFYSLMTYVLTSQKVNTYRINLDAPGHPPSTTQGSELKWVHVSWQDPASGADLPEPDEKRELKVNPKPAPDPGYGTKVPPPGWLDYIISHPVISFVFFLAMICVMIGCFILIWRNFISSEHSEMRRKRRKKGKNHYIHYDEKEKDRSGIGGSDPPPEPEPHDHTDAKDKQEDSSSNTGSSQPPFVGDLTQANHLQNLTQQINNLIPELTKLIADIPAIQKELKELKEEVGKRVGSVDGKGESVTIQPEAFPTEWLDSFSQPKTINIRFKPLADDQARQEAPQEKMSDSGSAEETSEESGKGDSEFQAQESSPSNHHLPEQSKETDEQKRRNHDIKKYMESIQSYVFTNNPDFLIKDTDIREISSHYYKSLLSHLDSIENPTELQKHLQKMINTAFLVSTRQKELLDFLVKENKLENLCRMEVNPSELNSQLKLKSSEHNWSSFQNSPQLNMKFDNEYLDLIDAVKKQLKILNKQHSMKDQIIHVVLPYLKSKDSGILHDFVYLTDSDLQNDEIANKE